MKSKNRLLDFLFGKETDIFNKKGVVEHHFTKEWWKQWENRFNKPEFDWRHHHGAKLINKTHDNQKIPVLKKM